MKELAGAFNQEKALEGAISVITNLRMDLFEALLASLPPTSGIQLTAYNLATMLQFGL